jgi:hypothetical protein
MTNMRQALKNRERDERALFFKLREQLPELKELLARIVGDEFHSSYEDRVYRFYHCSFKVYGIQNFTTEIVAALQALAPKRALNQWFTEIIKQGTGHEFDQSHNREWLLRGRPMLEAFFHAKFMLEMGVKHGELMMDLEAPPQSLDSGWAAFLYLYNLR